MKRQNIFGIDVTDDKNNRTIFGEKYIVRRGALDVFSELQACGRRLSALQKRTHPNLAQNFLIAIFFFLAVFYLTACIIYFQSLSPLELLRQHPLIFLPFLLLLSIGNAYCLHFGKKCRQVLNSPEYLDAEQALKKAREAAFQSMNIGENAIEIDVLYTHFHRTNTGFITDKIAWDVYDLPLYSFFDNQKKFVWVKNGSLFLAGEEEVLSVPLSSLGKIRKHFGFFIDFPNWNKSVSYRSRCFWKYFVRRDGNAISFYQIPYYCSLEIGEEEELLIPNYDAAVVRSIKKTEGKAK